MEAFDGKKYRKHRYYDFPHKYFWFVKRHSNLTHLIFNIGIDNRIIKEELNKPDPVLETNVRLEYTPLRLNSLYITVACWTYLAIMYVIPFLALLILNIW